MTPLDKLLKRAIRIDGRDYVITISPAELKLTQKGHRLGLELKWADMIRGDSALAIALQASVGKFGSEVPAAKAFKQSPSRSKANSSIILAPIRKVKRSK